MQYGLLWKILFKNSNKEKTNRRFFIEERSIMMKCFYGEVNTKMQESIDQEYHKLNKNRWLKPKDIVDKIIGMIFIKHHYKNGKSVDI
jgi:hypothetical protein